ncbi:hypothetical protein [Xanthomonas pisi]|uniref:hypothetical protein n=1 Tax=Xanthomonas pisi TaxID=56457 RepID=UPI000AC4FC37|nr:hypothetical protein [Xanthomonas pisi]
MKRAFFALLMAASSFGLHADTARSEQWQRNLLLLGENGGSRSRLVELLGIPAVKQHIVVNDPTAYLRGGPAHCFALSKGQELQAWYYPSDEAGYWVILKNGTIQCIAFEPAHTALLVLP